MKRSNIGKVVFDSLPENSSLIVNTKSYRIKKSQKQGESELVRLSREVPSEGVWFYDSSKSIWYNILKSSRKKLYKDGFFHFESEIRHVKFNQLGSRLVHYHTHPLESAKCLFPLMEERFEEDIIEKVGMKRNLIKMGLSIASCLSVALPTEDDLIVYRQIEDIYPKIDLTTKIASPLGITLVDVKKLSERIIKRYEFVRQEITNVSIVKHGLDFEGSKKERIIRPNYKRMLGEINNRMDGKMNISFNMTEDLDIPYFC